MLIDQNEGGIAYLLLSKYLWAMSATRQEILVLGEDLIRSKGYNAFSYKDISSVLNIRNAAVHYHFPSKTDLGLAVIDKTMQELEDQTVVWASLDAAERMDKFICIYEKSQERNLICFMGALGSAYETLPEPMQEKLREASEQILDWLKGVLADGKADGSFQFTESIDEKAHNMVSSLLSALILNRVTKQDILGSVVAGIRKTL